MSKWPLLLLLLGTCAIGCGVAASPPHQGTGGTGADMAVGSGDDMSVNMTPGADMAQAPGDMAQVLQIIVEPADQVLAMDANGTPPTLQLTAKVNGLLISPSWSIDRGELGNIGVSSGLFTASGTQGGKATITATYAGQTGSTTVSVAITWKQGGGDPDYPPPPKPGAGGYGGVGGDGPAPGPNPTQTGTLDGTPTADSSVSILYPYDGTVWPRGLLPPSIQWAPGTHKFDSVKIRLKEGSFDYTGYFAAQKSDPSFVFKNVPIPKAVWKELGNSNNGTEDVAVALVFGEAGKAYGPYTMRWKIARGSLRGTVYYNSYGTAFVQNSGEPSCGPKDTCYCAPGTSCTITAKTGPAFGAATLGINPGVTDPFIVAGKSIANPTNSIPRPGCRACHSVAANGTRLMVNDPDNNYNTSYAYDLTQPSAPGVEYGSNWPIPNNPNNSPQPNNSSCFNCAWSNIFPAFLPTGQYYLSSSGGQRGDSNSYLYSSDTPVNSAPIATVKGLNGLRAAMPVFSNDGKHVAFNDQNYDSKSLGMMDFDFSTMTFSNHVQLYTPTTGTVTWSAFLPASDGIIFELEKGSQDSIHVPSLGDTRWNTGELWWYDIKSKKAAPLSALNGFDKNGQLYLPTNSDNHGAAIEPVLNYEPTVCPILSGGYAWVVFTTRRIYGNIATINGYMSDPRDYDWQNNVTTKKLWVAAIDVNAPGGTDPSHPAFYLPAQELYAGNARGFWTAARCHKDGDGCETGDECCGGYCRAGSSSGDMGTPALQCLSTPPSCATEYEKCTTTADCCGHEKGGIQCVNNICSSGPIT